MNASMCMRIKFINRNFILESLTSLCFGQAITKFE